MIRQLESLGFKDEDFEVAIYLPSLYVQSGGRVVITHRATNNKAVAYPNDLSEKPSDLIKAAQEIYYNTYIKEQ